LSVTNFLQDLLIALFAAGGLVTLILGAFGWFWYRGYTFAESGVYAMMSVFMGLSCIYQLTFLIGYPQLALLFESLWLIWVLKKAWRLRSLCGVIIQSLKRMYQSSPWILGLLSLIWLYLGLQAFLLPPESWHWQQLLPVLWLERMGSFGGGEMPCAVGMLVPVNHSILPHFFLRFHSDLGIGLFSFCAYMSIGLTTYALARRYAWPPTSLTVTIIVLCLPRFVYLSTTPSSELIVAAVCAFCLLAIYRSVEQPNVVDFLFILWGILFAISDHPLSPVCAMLLLVLAFVLLLRRHGVTTWQSLMTQHCKTMLVGIFPAIIFSQGWLFLYYRLTEGTFSHFRLMAPFPQNTDVIKGALANFLRYGIESLHMTQAVELAATRSVGVSLVELGQKFHDVVILPILGSSGALQSFRLVWGPNDIFSWFGPLGAFLVFPSLVYALVRGQRRLKATALVLIGYLYIVVLIVGWEIGNASYFSPLYSCSAFLTAFLLPPWRISNAGKKRLQGLCVLLILYASFFNTAKPAAGGGQRWVNHPDTSGKEFAIVTETAESSFAHSIWSQSHWGQNRLMWAQKVFQDGRIEAFYTLLPKGATLWVSAHDPALLYPLLLHRPDLHICLYDESNAESGVAFHRHHQNITYICAWDHEFEKLPTGIRTRLVWSAAPESSGLPAELRQIDEPGAGH
jgi:hypothetical protein